MELIAFRNRAGKLAVQIDGEGALVLFNGETVPEDHPFWVESEEDPAEMGDLTDEQRATVEEIISLRERTEAARQAQLTEQDKRAAARYLRAVLKSGDRTAARDEPEGKRAFERLTTKEEQEAVALEGKAIQAEKDRRDMEAFDRMLRDVERLAGLR